LHNDLTIMHYVVIDKTAIYYVISCICWVSRRVSYYDIIEKSAIYHMIPWVWGGTKKG
jgi:hypothetical protein